MSDELSDRLRGYQNEMLCNGPSVPLFDRPDLVIRDLGMAAADIDLMRAELEASRTKRSELRRWPTDALTNDQFALVDGTPAETHHTAAVAANTPDRGTSPIEQENKL